MMGADYGYFVTLWMGMPEIDWLTLAIFVTLVAGCLIALDRGMAKARRLPVRPGPAGRAAHGSTATPSATPSMAIEENTDEMGHP